MAWTLFLFCFILNMHKQFTSFICVIISMINYGIKSKMDQLVQILCSTGNVNIDIQISKFLTFLVQILSQKLKIETGICFQFELCMYVMFEI